MSLLARTIYARPVDWIVSARAALTMDSQRRLIENGAVAIEGNDVVAVGERSAIEQQFQARQRLDRPDAVVMPGLVDTHTHAPMSLLRAIADDMRLQDWLEHFIFPAEAKNVDREFVRWGTRLACLEMVLAGITTYTDMYYFEDVEAETAREAGVRGVLGQSIIGFPAPDYKTWQQALTATEQFFQRFAHDDLITPAVAPHSIYTLPNEALQQSRALANRYSRPLLIHLAETRKERDDALAARKMTPTAALEALGVFEGRTVAAHAVWESDADLEILKKHDVGVAHCPSSNTKLASGIARVTDMLRIGIATGLGTDGFAGSNDSADLFAEVNLAAKLQKVTRADPTAVPAEAALAMATVGGARVLGMEKTIGSLEPGKRADLITVSLNGPNAQPLYNLYSFLGYAVKAGDVQDVFIGGKPIVRDRKPLTLNVPEIYAAAKRYRQQILLSLRK